MKSPLFILFVTVGIVLFIMVLILNMQQKQSTNSVAQPIANSNVQQTKKQGKVQATFFNANTPVPELTDITAWLNPNKPLTLKSLRGKVILVDFWTNQCINCIHTLPYVTKWYDKYKDKGFVVLGVHTPELAFERTIASIQTAITTYGIHYPVAQDNNYATWNAFNNQYWPAEYLIDKQGIIRRTHFGEGEYDQTELAIQALLNEPSR